MQPVRFARAASAAAALLLAAAPASAQRSRCTAGMEVSPPTRPHEAAAGQLRSAISDTLHVHLLAAAAEEGIADPAGLVLVELGSARGVGSVRIHDGNLPEPLVRRVVSEQESLLAAWPGPSPVLFVRLDRLDRPEPADGGSPVECMPRLRSMHTFRSMLGRMARENRQFLPAHGTAVKLLMLVDREGRVVYATVTELGASARLERQMIDSAYRLRFDPATVAGIPVDVWVEQPVDFPRER